MVLDKGAILQKLGLSSCFTITFFFVDGEGPIATKTVANLKNFWSCKSTHASNCFACLTLFICLIKRSNHDSLEYWKRYHFFSLLLTPVIVGDNRSLRTIVFNTQNK